jgi:dTMP kinase
MTLKNGIFLTLEGVDGAGKSTHVQWTEDFLSSRGTEVVSTREPGGTPLGEKLRDLVLHEPMALEAETLLMFAARAQHLKSVIQPALALGKWVICDRFTDATYAYQGGGRELGEQRIAKLEQWTHPDLQPTRTWIFDVPLEVARERLNRTREQDRFEQEADSFFQRTRAAYLDRAQRFPDRIKVIDSSRSIESIRAELEMDLLKLLDQFRKA